MTGTRTVFSLVDGPARVALGLALGIALAVPGTSSAGQVTKKELRHAEHAWSMGAGLSTAGWIVGGTGVLAGGAAVGLGVSGADEASPIMGAAATALLGVGVPLAGLAGGWARTGCASVGVKQLNKAGRITGWVFYGTGMTFGLAGTIMGFAEVPWGGSVVGGIGLILGIGALVMLEIDAHAHLAMLRDGIRAAKKKSDLDGGAPRPVVLVLPWAGGTRAPAAGVAAVARW